MVFFLNDQPPSSESGDEAPDTSHSPKSAPLFKQEATPLDQLGRSPLSLSDYVSKHLGEATAAQQKPAPSPASPASWLNPGQKVRRPASEHATVGQFLNSLDVDLPSGLEQYLPTPAFRLRVIKKRLDGEIMELQGLLNKYSRLPNPSLDMKERIAAVRHRLRVLENHESRVTWQLADTMPMGSVFYKLSRGTAGYTKALGYTLNFVGRGLSRFLYGRSYLAMESSGVELRELESILRRRMKDSASSDAELGQLINRYEHTLRQAERQVEDFSRHSFLHRLWQEARGLVE